MTKQDKNNSDSWLRDRTQELERLGRKGLNNKKARKLATSMCRNVDMQRLWKQLILNTTDTTIRTAAMEMYLRKKKPTDGNQGGSSHE